LELLTSDAGADADSVVATVFVADVDFNGSDAGVADGSDVGVADAAGTDAAGTDAAGIDAGAGANFSLIS
jgi:hypothetical protein